MCRRALCRAHSLAGPRDGHLLVVLAVLVPVAAGLDESAVGVEQLVKDVSPGTWCGSRGRRGQAGRVGTRRVGLAAFWPKRGEARKPSPYKKRWLALSKTPHSARPLWPPFWNPMPSAAQVVGQSLL